MKKIKMKKALIFILITVLVTATGCAKVINTKYKEGDIKIINIYHRAAYVTPVHAGKVTTFITHPAIYRTYVEYEGVKYTLSGSNIYNKCKNKIGQTVKGKLKIDTYDDKTIEYKIIEILEK